MNYINVIELEEKGIDKKRGSRPRRESLRTKLRTKAGRISIGEGLMT